MKKVPMQLLLAVTLLAVGATASAQDIKVYKEGAATAVTYVRTKPGRFDDYMKFLSTTYRK